MKYHRVLSVLLFISAGCISPGQLLAQSVEKTSSQQLIEERMAANLPPNRGESNMTLPYFESGKGSVTPASANLLATSTDVCMVDPTIDQWSLRRSLPITTEQYSQSLRRVPFWLSEALKPQPETKQGVDWKDTLMQSLTFTVIMNTFRIATEPSTRKDLKGPFWKDYVNSVKSLRGWRDGDEFLVNYIGHPLEGAVSGNILLQNDPTANKLSFGRSKQYWMSRLKAFGWAAAISTQFELGPFGEASIGNVGLTPSEKSRHPAAYVDLVVTPVLGTGWLIGEDILDRFLIKKIERRTTNRFVRSMFRSWLTPGKSFANMLRGEWWWHRDDRPLKEGGRDQQQ
jgi:hypothetical protein